MRQVFGCLKDVLITHEHLQDSAGVSLLYAIKLAHTRTTEYPLIQTLYVNDMTMSWYHRIGKHSWRASH